MIAKDESVFVPPTSCEWLIERLFEIGPIASGMTSGPISWGEIAEYQRQTGFRLLPWQSRLLRRLSGEFAAESERAQAHDCPAPWVAENVDERLADARSAVDRQFDAFFDACDD